MHSRKIMSSTESIVNKQRVYMETTVSSKHCNLKSR